MTKVAIMTDTNSGFSKEDAEQRGIYLLSMPFTIDGVPLYEGISLSLDEFYEKMDAGADVSTSQPPPLDVMGMWNSILKEGYDEIVYIPMSSGLSNSCYSACAYAEEYEGKVQVVDNHRISVTLKQSVLDALELAKDGLNAVDIKEALEREAYEASIYIALDTLKYLKKGGRVTAAGAAIGQVLNIKPVLTIQGDKLDAHEKVRGMKAARRAMLKSIEKDINERFDFLYKSGKLAMFMVYSHVPENILKSWKEEIQEAFPNAEVKEDSLSMSIGCHIGPGALAVAICKIGCEKK